MPIQKRKDQYKGGRARGSRTSHASSLRKNRHDIRTRVEETAEDRMSRLNTYHELCADMIPEIPQKWEDLKSAVTDKQHSSLLFFQKLVSVHIPGSKTNPHKKQYSPPHYELYTIPGFLERVVHLLQSADVPIMQLASLILANVSGGTQDATKAVLNAQAVPVLLKFVCHPDSAVSQRALWTLANISGDDPEFRDYVIGHGLADQLKTLLQNYQNQSIHQIHNMAWMLSNFFRGTPKPKADVEDQLISLWKMLRDVDSKLAANNNGTSPLKTTFMKDIAWSMYYYTQSVDDAKLQKLYDQGLMDIMVERMKHPSDEMSAYTRAINNILEQHPFLCKDVWNRTLVPENIMAVVENPSHYIYPVGSKLAVTLFKGVCNEDGSIMVDDKGLSVVDPQRVFEFASFVAPQLTRHLTGKSTDGVEEALSALELCLKLPIPNLTEAFLKDGAVSNLCKAASNCWFEGARVNGVYTSMGILSGLISFATTNGVELLDGVPRSHRELADEVDNLIDIRDEMASTITSVPTDHNQKAQLTVEWITGLINLGEHNDGLPMDDDDVVGDLGVDFDADVDDCDF